MNGRPSSLTQSMTSSSSRQPQLGLAHLLALIPGALFGIAFIFRPALETATAVPFTLFDDAMISMTYARTFVETGELVWFPGADRVQGITNPLWTLYMAVVHSAGFEGSSANLMVSLTSLVLVLASGLAVASLVLSALPNVRYARTASVVSGGTVPFLYPTLFWALRGMEVGLLAFATVLMLRASVGVLSRWADSDRASSGWLLLFATTSLVEPDPVSRTVSVG